MTNNKTCAILFYQTIINIKNYVSDSDTEKTYINIQFDAMVQKTLIKGFGSQFQ
jgi:hypothetical protein